MIIAFIIAILAILALWYYLSRPVKRLEVKTIKPVLIPQNRGKMTLMWGSVAHKSKKGKIINQKGAYGSKHMEFACTPNPKRKKYAVPNGIELNTGAIPGQVLASEAVA